jgi:Lar family restriction alleviation protein
MSDIKLLPCPFCGGEARIESNGNFSDDIWFAFAACLTCKAQGPMLKGPKIEICEVQAADAWNRRAPQPADTKWDRLKAWLEETREWVSKQDQDMDWAPENYMIETMTKIIPNIEKGVL